MTPRRLLPPLTACLVLLCAACTSPADPDASPSAAAVTSDVVALVPGGYGQTGPLAELVGTQPDPTSPSYVEDVQAQVRAQEEAIAACMAEQGFEYAMAVVDPEDVVRPDPDVPVRGSREFAEEYGYGITDAPPEPGQYTAESSAIPGFSEWSQAEQDAYWEALNGRRVNEVQDGEGSTTYDTEGGCLNLAQTGGADDPSAAFEEESWEFLGALPDDGRFDALDAEWSRCMADEGYEYASPHAAYRAVADTSFGVPLDDDHVQDPAAATEAGDLEMRVALADLECQVGTDYLARWRELSDAAQQEFLDAHRAEVDAWLEAQP
ncbi:conserved hypothetical protein [Cellulomonas flavigena DSM 20109]|uniref:Uncharacterized protein n=1 Tax=Cellulomonas flavigena (strain ATCC 482 / DSM 20109 / BCRC 11376 / JCM 18109 / NBRC 3775 / NCIMB 8073 / NRS 134) TaxID=446466 RepID=D5UI28_CELFN|nr:hypothetical protein [Cellulomonas flavigena]ADG75373.1 conserved hypothetical protein [Cellulomonas flavigena DSM 20109]